MAVNESVLTSGLYQQHKLPPLSDFKPERSASSPEYVDFRALKGTLASAMVGDISLTELYSDDRVVRQCRGLVSRATDAYFFLHLQLDGDSTNRQGGREALLKTGDYTLLDNTKPYEVVYRGPNRTLVVGIPHSKLRRQIACPEGLVAVPMKGTQGTSGLLSRLLINYWTECRHGLEPAAAERASVAVIDMLSAAYADIPRVQSDHSSLGMLHRTRIVNYIEVHLHDPDLTPTRVAVACKITPRYLHHLFAGEDETVARYILRRRLDACAAALISSSQRGRSVTAIAFDHGFNSPTHFGRVFRAKFGATPREYRQARGQAAWDQADAVGAPSE